MKKEKIGLATSAAGATTTGIGVIGAGCFACAPICASAKLAGMYAIVTMLFGASTATFLSQYHLFFMGFGFLTSIIGIVLFVRARKKAINPDTKCH